ncbi:MAG: methyltransferase domain-containing protein [Zoogloeaceae bacterium]|jgi:SAM-dependent methyltransferase|nr:methyltransferase domain-containing protein [Zoogloeaceae bacterium]
MSSRHETLFQAKPYDLDAFLAYWETEGAGYARRGDYDWMAERLAQSGATRVLEIGCGVGFGTATLLARGFSVLALDVLPPCLEAARQKVAAEAKVTFLAANLAELAVPDHPPAALRSILDFQPQAVLCWLMGAPQDMTRAPDKEASAAVAAYREQMHRHVAQLAARLPEVAAVHLVDRTVIPWQAKDLGRDTLVRYHLFKTFVDLPFEAVRQDAQYRKLEGDALAEDLAQLRRSHPALKSATPTLASLLARRRETS